MGRARAEGLARYDGDGHQRAQWRHNHTAGVVVSVAIQVHVLPRLRDLHADDRCRQHPHLADAAARSAYAVRPGRVGWEHYLDSACHRLGILSHRAVLPQEGCRQRQRREGLKLTARAIKPRRICDVGRADAFFAKPSLSTASLAMLAESMPRPSVAWLLLQSAAVVVQCTRPGLQRDDNAQQEAM